MDLAFQRGGVLVEHPMYKIHAGRRDVPGQAERHERDTDIFHVLDGRGEIVIGGVIRGARTIAPGEVRGEGIDGGEVVVLAPGDILVIPAGLPHWFRSVQDTMLYFVVKVTSTAPES